MNKIPNEVKITKNGVFRDIIPKIDKKFGNKKRKTSEIAYRTIKYIQIILYNFEKNSAMIKIIHLMHAFRCDQEYTA
jgi:hypothetical protein